MPSTRTDFWLAKFEANIRRDNLQQQQLTELGWRVIIVWECELRADREKVIENLSEVLSE